MYRIKKLLIGLVWYEKDQLLFIFTFLPGNMFPKLRLYRLSLIQSYFLRALSELELIDKKIIKIDVTWTCCANKVNICTFAYS